MADLGVFETAGCTKEPPNAAPLPYDTPHVMDHSTINTNTAVTIGVGVVVEAKVVHVEVWV